MEYARHAVQFFTAGCNDWQKLLAEDDYKQLVIDALKFRVSRGEVKVGAFVPIAIGMPNHIHLIWRIQNGFELETVQRDFLKFTAKALVEKIKAEKGEAALELLYVGLKDRKYQVWKRNSMSIDLITENFFKQKLEYVHNNPCQPHWNLAQHQTEYRYSLARYYDRLGDEFGLVTHMEES